MIVCFLNDPRGRHRRAARAVLRQTFFFWLVLLFVDPDPHHAADHRGAPERHHRGADDGAGHRGPGGGRQVPRGARVLPRFCGCRPWSTPSSSPATARSTGGRSPRATSASSASARCSSPSASSPRRSPGTRWSAAIVTFALLVPLFTLGFLENLVTGDVWQEVLGYVNLLRAHGRLRQGIVDTRRLVYYVTTAALFLFFTAAPSRRRSGGRSMAARHIAQGRCSSPTRPLAPASSWWRCSSAWSTTLADALPALRLDREQALPPVGEEPQRRRRARPRRRGGDLPEPGSPLYDPVQRAAVALRGRNPPLQETGRRPGRNLLEAQRLVDRYAIERGERA